MLHAAVAGVRVDAVVRVRDEARLYTPLETSVLVEVEGFFSLRATEQHGLVAARALSFH
jgi:hypothetical protein